MPTDENVPVTRPERSTWDRLADIPHIDDAPLDDRWLPRDTRHFRVNAAPEPEPATLPSSSPSGPLPETSATPEVPRRWKRRLVALVVLVPVGLAVCTTIYSWYLWRDVEKIGTNETLSPSSSGFTNYLIVGVDSREGVDPDLETAPQIGLGNTGNRSDTMVILHVGDRGNRLVSLPRDLWVDISGFGSGKLNAATVRGGAPTLIQTVQTGLDIPVHHYLEVDIAGFLNVVEALGSISIPFAAPACDHKSGLDVRANGDVDLDAEQALAYVRSRSYREFSAQAGAGLTCAEIRRQGIGSQVGNADFGRTERQRRFLLAVFDDVAASRNPITVLRVLSGLTDGLRVDDSMGMFDALGLLRDLRGLDAEPLAIPVSDLQVGGAAALSLNSSSNDVLVLLR